MLAQLVVELSLDGLQLAIERLLQLGGQFFGYPGLSATQNKGAQGPRQQGTRLFVGAAGARATQPKNRS